MTKPLIMTDHLSSLRASLLSFPVKVRRWIKPGFLPRPRQNVWQWAAANIDFSLATNYDTPIKGKYDPDFMPFWKEPVECLTDTKIKEVIALKCARAGGTENLLLNPARYAVAMRPQPTLYVTGDQLSAERMMDRRIKRSMRCSKATASQYRHAQSTQHDITFPSMDLRVTWPKAKQAFKQDGWALILCDEVSTWPEFSADMARKRTASYPFAHIVFASSPDPQAKRGSDEDPIFVEYWRGDQRRWTCRDGNGADFVFEMGRDDTPHGLKWDKAAKREDATWDLDAVRKSAHYATPSGAVIYEPDRMAVVRAGRWEPSNMSAPENVRSYHVNAFMTPFDSFGGIAVAFLKAQAAGPQALRTFIYEYLAEPWYGEKQVIESASVQQRRGAYKHGQRLATLPAYEYLTKKTSRVIMTVDVQKDRFFVVVREWFDGGDSALVEFAEVQMWKDLAAIRARHGAHHVGIDMGYSERRLETLDELFTGSMRGAIPIFGRDSLKEPFAVKRDYDPYEGTGKQGRARLPSVTFNPDTIKHALARLVDGSDPHQWLLPADIRPEYAKQVTAEECIDGAWVKRRRDNHALDCETMQLTLASVVGVFRQLAVDLEVPQVTIPQQAIRQRIRGIYTPE